MRRLLLVVLLALVTSQGAAVAQPDRVVGVIDGDTLDLLELGRVRLSGIDSPESNQPYGTRAKWALSAIAFGREVDVAVQGQDRYGRTVARLSVAGDDVGQRMVLQGYAWAYLRYGGHRYASDEAAARAQGAGLWSQPDPVAPWVFRRGRSAKQ